MAEREYIAANHESLKAAIRRILSSDESVLSKFYGFSPKQVDESVEYNMIRREDGDKYIAWWVDDYTTEMWILENYQETGCNSRSEIAVHSHPASKDDIIRNAANYWWAEYDVEATWKNAYRSSSETSDLIYEKYENDWKRELNVIYTVIFHSNVLCKDFITVAMHQESPKEDSYKAILVPIKDALSSIGIVVPQSLYRAEKRIIK